MGFYLQLEKDRNFWEELQAFDVKVIRFVPSQSRSYVDSLDRLRQEPGDRIWLEETPRGESTFALFIVSFRGRAEELVAGVRYSDAEGAMFRLERALELRINLVHGPYSGLQQCTVFCPASGESRSGPGACIDCRKDKSVVRICC